MLIPRNLTPHVQELTKYFPIVSVTGPRQAGKTTLLRFLFPDYEYISLENLDHQAYATTDPKSFLSRYSNKTILDEAQRVPSLFSYLQTEVDLKKQMGQYILSGSQNFLLRKNITQSLAGRVGILRLFPFTCKELQIAELEVSSAEETIYKGFYPSLYDRKTPPHLFYTNYIDTYLQRDVQDLINTGNLSLFHRFLRLCAGHVGQLINYTELSKSLGINQVTVKNWLSILEQSSILFQLYPYHRNFNKRVIKSTKLYFYDTGLVCNLLQMNSPRDVETYYQRGALFENLVVAELVKQAHHKGLRPNFYFWRDNHGNEIDLLRESYNGLDIIEIKSSHTLMPNHFKGIKKFQQWLKEENANFFMIYGGEEQQVRESVVTVQSWRNLDLF